MFVLHSFNKVSVTANNIYIYSIYICNDGSVMSNFFLCITHRDLICSSIVPFFIPTLSWWQKDAASLLPILTIAWIDKGWRMFSDSWQRIQWMNRSHFWSETFLTNFHYQHCHLLEVGRCAMINYWNLHIIHSETKRTFIENSLMWTSISVLSLEPIWTTFLLWDLVDSWFQWNECILLCVYC